MSRVSYSDGQRAVKLQVRSTHSRAPHDLLFVVRESYVRSNDLEFRLGVERWRGAIWTEGVEIQHDWDRRSVETMFPHVLVESVEPPDEGDDK